MYIKVKVYPDQKKDELRVIGENRFEARVRVPAERNMANMKVLELVSAHFKVPTRAIRIVSGHQSQSKILSLPDAS